MEESKPKEGHKGHSQHRTGFGCLAPECEFSGAPLNHVGALPAISRNPIILDRTIHLTGFLLTAIICHLEQGYAGYLCRLSFWTCGSVSVELIPRS